MTTLDMTLRRPWGSRAHRAAASVAVGYVVVGFAWLVAGDRATHAVSLLGTSTAAHSISAATYVLLSGGVLYVLLSRLLVAMARGSAQEEALAHQTRARSRERQQLVHRLLHAEEETRRGIARDLHDGPLQALTIAHMQVDALGRAVAGLTETDRERLAGALATIRESADDIRGIVRALQPPLLAEVGLVAALDRHCADAAARSGRVISFVTDGSAATRLSPDQATAVFRITQEALSNATRHTAGPIVVRLATPGRYLTVEIEDGGPGFVPEQEIGRGLGLLSMRERAESVGARFDLASSPRGGTRATVTLPVLPAG
ncbi:MAG: hypothetical protein AMXMBFR23_09540 [Chloroflexota bacterium]